MDPEEFPRLTELADRLVMPGGKAAHLSASELHEVADGVHSLIAELRRLRAEVDAVNADFRRVEGEAAWVTLHLSRIATAVGVTTHENAASSPEEVLRAVQVAVEDRRRIGLDLITVRAERDTARGEVARLTEENASLRGDRCDVCDDDGLIYILIGEDAAGYPSEEAQACPMCGGTKSGYASRVTKELAEARGEVSRLTGCLATANANHEKFERQWYLACDERDAAIRERDEARTRIAELVSEAESQRKRANDAEARARPGLTEEELDALRWVMGNCDVAVFGDSPMCNLAIGALRRLLAPAPSFPPIAPPAPRAVTADEDPGCSMRGRYDLGHGVEGRCAIRKDPVCPPACLLKSLKSREAEVRALHLHARAERASPAAPDPEAVERRLTEPSEDDVCRVADALYLAACGGAIDRWKRAARLAIAAGLDPSRIPAEAP